MMMMRLAARAGRRAVFAACALLAGASGGAATNSSWNAFSPAETRDEAVACLADAIGYEAGAEPLEGREAVAEVVLNRLRDPAFPKTVCGVVYQGSARRTGCQFTFTCDGSMARRRPGGERAEAERIAGLAIDGRLAPRVGGATFYHAWYVTPAWAARLTRIGRIGAHIFYASAGWNAAEPVARAASMASFAPWGLETAVVTAVGTTLAVRMEDGGALTPPAAPGTDAPPSR